MKGPLPLRLTFVVAVELGPRVVRADVEAVEEAIPSLQNDRVVFAYDIAAAVREVFDLHVTADARVFGVRIVERAATPGPASVVT